MKPDFQDGRFVANDLIMAVRIFVFPDEFDITFRLPMFGDGA
jgi:hypothetical protein